MSRGPTSSSSSSSSSSSRSNGHGYNNDIRGMPPPQKKLVSGPSGTYSYDAKKPPYVNVGGKKLHEVSRAKEKWLGGGGSSSGRSRYNDVSDKLHHGSSSNRQRSRSRSRTRRRSRSRSRDRERSNRSRRSPEKNRADKYQSSSYSSSRYAYPPPSSAASAAAASYYSSHSPKDHKEPLRPVAAAAAAAPTDATTEAEGYTTTTIVTTSSGATLSSADIEDTFTALGSIQAATASTPISVSATTNDEPAISVEYGATVAPEAEEGEEKEDPDTGRMADGKVVESGISLQLAQNVSVIMIPVYQFGVEADWEQFVSHTLSSDQARGIWNADLPKALIRFLDKVNADHKNIQIFFVCARKSSAANFSLSHAKETLSGWVKKKCRHFDRVFADVFEYQPDETQQHDWAKLYKAMWQSNSVFNSSSLYKYAVGKNAGVAFLSCDTLAEPRTLLHQTMTKSYPPTAYPWVIALTVGSSATNEFEYKKVLHPQNVPKPT